MTRWYKLELDRLETITKGQLISKLLDLSANFYRDCSPGSIETFTRTRHIEEYRQRMGRDVFAEDEEAPDTLT